MHHTHATTQAHGAEPLREQLSALMDGECTPHEAEQLSQVWAESSELKQAWRDFDAVGCALRAHVQAVGPRAPHTQPSDFVQGVMARLEPQAWVAAEQPVLPVQLEAPKAAANDAVFRWKALASVATMAAVVSVAWQLGGVGTPTASTMASAAPESPPVVVAASPAMASAAPNWQQVATQQGTMIRDAELELLLSAHRQHGGMTALQMPAGFLRTATFDTSVR